MKNAFLSTLTLWKRELVRFYRQPSRVVGAIASPFVFWLFIGSGLGASFRSQLMGNQGYLEYFYPGTILLILLFTAIFSTISIIEDRREGFLQGVLVAPIPRLSFVCGKILGGASIAFLQALLFLAFSPLIGIKMTLWGWFAVGALLFLNAVVLTGLGFLIAWRFNSVQGFHAVMNLLLMPIWILSGALFPSDGAASWVQILMKLNPLTYSMASLRMSLYEGRVDVFPGSIGISVLVTFIFGSILFGLSLFSVSQRQEG